MPPRGNRPVGATAPIAAVPRFAAAGGNRLSHPPGDFCPIAEGDRAKMGQGGLEPPTPRLSSVCSNQLSYWPPSQALAPNTPGHDGPGPAGTSSRHGRRMRGRRRSRWNAPPGSGARRMRSPVGALRASQRRCAMGYRDRPGTPRPPSGGHDLTTPVGDVCSLVRSRSSREASQMAGPSPRSRSLKGGDPAAGSPTATLLRLHPSH